MSFQGHRDRRPARRAVPVDKLPLILVVCEGAVTERQYLEGFRRWCQNPRVEPRYVGPAGVPLTLVSKALELKTQAEQGPRRSRWPPIMLPP